MDESLEIRQAERQEELAFLITEIMDVIKKRNPPIEEAVTALLINTTEIARNCKIPLDLLQDRLDKMYAIAHMSQEDVEGIMGGTQ
jgi:hypothetical protein